MLAENKIWSNDNKIKKPRIKKFHIEHLYLIRNIYYFRYTIPPKYRKLLGKSEIRVNLKTAYRYEAKKQASIIYAKILIQLEEVAMGNHFNLKNSEDTRTFKTSFMKETSDAFEQVSTSDQVNDYVQAEDIYLPKKEDLEEYCDEYKNTKVFIEKKLQKQQRAINKEFLVFLDRNDKITITNNTIKLRFNGLLQKLLDDDSLDINRRQTKNNEFDIQYFDLINSSAKITESFINNLELLELNILDVLELVLVHKLFIPEEITHENLMFLVNEYYKMLKTYYDILLARLNSDYILEQNIYSAPSITYPPELQMVQTTSKTTPLLASQLFELYLKARINEGKIDTRLFRDNLQRLENLIFILGDKAITDYTRQDFRTFQEKLQQMPVGRTKNKLYKDKNVDELLTIHPKKTLATKSVNDIIILVSASFEWAITEGHLDSKNHAKGLTIQDKRPDIDKREAFSLAELQTIFTRVCF